MNNNKEHMPYEGAGFLLTRDGNVILGERIKKEKDLKKDPTPELEYMGGKVEPTDIDPYDTARCELTEELGQDILSADWVGRAQVIHIFQPFSKKWIWCFRLELNDNEYDRLVSAAHALKAWPNAEMRDFSKLTGRAEPARKALRRLVTVPNVDLVEYCTLFNRMDTQNDGNRMKDAKDFRAQCNLGGVDLLDQHTEVKMPLRAFNTVMFAQHTHALAQ